MKKILSLLFIALLLLPSGASAAQLYDDSGMVVQTMGSGEINWSLLTIRAAGQGGADPGVKDIAVARLGKERAAKIAAIRKLAESFKLVSVDATTTVDNFMTASDFVNKRVEAALRGARIVEKKFISDEAVEITVEMSVTGLLTEILIPHAGDLEPPAVGDEIYSGLVIDATGLGIRPVMAPRILDEQYREVYGPSFISKEAALRRGIALYEREAALATSNDRVSGNPLMIRGIGATGSNTNVMISSADARALREGSGNLSFLRQGRVIIVID